MSTNPVNAWDQRALIAPETTFGTTPAPANIAAYAALALENIDVTTGPAEVGAVRAKKDRSLGRGMQSGFVEGRVAPIAWSAQLSVKSRSAIDADPRELALYKMAGLKKTTNAAVSCVLAPSATPIESLDFASATITRFLGSGLATYQAEILRGCLVQGLRWEGGDKEVTLKANGLGVGKLTQGGLDSVTMLIGATTLTHTAEESYRLSPGYYLCESEVILVTSVGYGSTTSNITKGALASTSAAHTAKPFQPYVPAGITFAGSPIPEPVSTLTVGGITVRAQSWFFELATGLDMLPGETGSKYVQGAKYTRYAAKLGARLVLSGDQVSLMGKVTQRPNLAVAISQGVGVGSIWSASLPYAEVEPFAAPDTANDVAVVDVTFRTRDNAGNDLFSVTLT
jgi:hypothetical protein